MTALRKFEVVGSDELMEYPIPSAVRLDSHFFMMFNYRRWMNSDFRNLADREVRAVAIDLFCAAQEQSPVGTLPTDERLLARVVDVSLDVWRQLAAREVSPLHNWHRCICDDGQVRLYHPVVLEVAQAASGLRGDHEEKLAADRERKRLPGPHARDHPGTAGGIGLVARDAILARACEPAAAGDAGEPDRDR